MTRRRALVTGATGFLGSRLVAWLVCEGWEVHAVVRASSDNSEIAAVAREIALYRLDEADALNVAIRAARGGVVFHLAAEVSSESSVSNIRRLVDANITFGIALLEGIAADGGEIRVINTGTSWQHYGGNAKIPVNLYAATKQAFDSILRFYTDAFDLKAVTLELYDTYGPRDPRSDKLLQLIDRHARSGQALDMSPGEQRLNMVHVDDVVQAFGAASDWLESPAYLPGRSFAVRGAEQPTLREIVATFEAATGRRVPVHWGGRAYRTREVMIPWSGDETVPGWRPATLLSEGIARMYPSDAN